MPKFRVTLLETVRYEIALDADSASEAESMARAVWENSESPSSEFESQGYGIEITHVIDENGESV